MYVDKVILDEVDETAQEIVVHSVLDQRNSPPDYSYVKKQLQKLVVKSIAHALDETDRYELVHSNYVR
jgi:hypothetical protein